MLQHRQRRGEEQSDSSTTSFCSISRIPDASYVRAHCSVAMLRKRLSSLHATRLFLGRLDNPLAEDPYRRQASFHHFIPTNQLETFLLSELSPLRSPVLGS